MGVVIVSVEGNVYGVAIAPPNREYGDVVRVESPSRVFKRYKIKYRANGQRIYFYKRVDTDAK